MAGVRRVTRSILRYVFPLYLIAILLQVYFAGEGIFGDRDKEVVIGEHDSLELHRGFGWIISQPIALLVLILALLAWFPDKRVRWLSIAAPILLIVQSLLPSAGRWVAALHPVNAFVLVFIFGWLSWTLWKGRTAVEEQPAASAA
jgi:Family of unknown function (DUF6220)